MLFIKTSYFRSIRRYWKWIGGLKPHEKENTLHTHNGSYNIDCLLYRKKHGRRLYTYKKVCGFRITAYKFNLYGVVPNGEMPCYSIGYGTLDNGKTLYLHHTTPDIEI